MSHLDPTSMRVDAIFAKQTNVLVDKRLASIVLTKFFMGTVAPYAINA